MKLSRKLKATKKAGLPNPPESEAECSGELEIEIPISLYYTLHKLAEEEHVSLEALANAIIASEVARRLQPEQDYKMLHEVATREGELWKRAFDGARAECKGVRETLGKANARYINLQSALKQDLKAMVRRARQRKETFMEIPLASLMFLVSDPLDLGQNRAEENIGGGGKEDNA